MAAYQHIFPQTTSRAESPAKVFAKLKSKVDREASCGKDGVYTRKDRVGKVKEKPGAEFKSPRKRTDRDWSTDELDESRGLGFVCEALTISPMSSPQGNFGYSCEGWSSNLAEDAVGERRYEGGFPESTVGSQTFDIANRTQSPTEAPQVRGGFDAIHRIQAAESDFVREGKPPPTASPSVFSPMRSKLRKRKSPSSGLHSEPCPFGVLSLQTLDKDLSHLKGLHTSRFDKNQTMLPAQTRKSFFCSKFLGCYS